MEKTKKKPEKPVNAKPTYLSPGISAEATRAFFAAAARLFRAAPWKIVPDDLSVFRVTIESLGVRDAVLSVIGQMGRSLGFLFFDSEGDFELYLEAADILQDGGEPPPLPAHFALNYDPGAELDPSLRKEITSHGWEVAGPAAYPWLIAIDDLLERPPSAEDLTRFEAIALALAEVVETEQGLESAWESGPGVLRTISTQTRAGTIDVKLQAPYEGVDPPGDDELDDEAGADA